MNLNNMLIYEDDARAIIIGVKEKFDIENIIIPEGVVEICDSAFQDCTSLKRVVVPGSCKTIGSAFIGCNNLKIVEMCEGVNIIDGFAFCNCSSLEKIVIPDGIEVIFEKTFANCISLKSIELPGSIKEIRDFAFDGCINLEKCIVNCDIKIGEFAFRGCNKLKK